jgi:hypothetical protein
MPARMGVVAKAQFLTELEKCTEKPNFEHFAYKYTINITTVRCNWNQIKQRRLFGTTIASNRLGTVPSTTLEIKEVVEYLLIELPFIY